MDSRRGKKTVKDRTRRTFLQTMSAGVPTLALALKAGAPEGEEQETSGAENISAKFTPVDLSAHYNASPADLGPRPQARALSGESARDGFIRTPTGRQYFRGIPFSLGAEGLKKKCWVALSARHGTSAASSVEVPLGQKATFVCLAAFCEWDTVEASATGIESIEKVGQRLAEAILIYEDASQKALPVRRRFEVNALSFFLGHLCFAAEPHAKDAPTRLIDSLKNAAAWGGLQTGVRDSHYPSGPDGRPLATVWVSALANPEPEKTLRSLRLQAAAEDLLCICGLTLYHGQENPLRYERLKLYRLTLPDTTAEDLSRWDVAIDLGVVARTFALPEFDPKVWLTAPAKGLGERTPPVHGAQQLYVELTASPDATLTLRDTKNGKSYSFDLAQVVPGRELESRPSEARIEVLETRKVWVHGKVIDAATRRSIPARLAFRSREGRYIPPYGHRTEVNDGWFQDYGADLKLSDSTFAYIDGTFQVELPVGDVYVEMTKGFEYEAVRKKLTIEPAQRELTLEIPRFLDGRSQGWVTADTHVHFLSPTTAILEGQAEGLNLINLLAAQWGDLFTNVGDLSYGPIASHDKETLVWVGTENRQHILGHLGLLGGHGEAVYPMSATGPSESYLGDPLWTTLAEWADACRRREGVVVRAHFPIPTGEEAADIVLGKIDALEIIDASALYPQSAEPFQAFNNLRYLDWYRYLNCGYRLPVVGGTDKMSAWMPVGANRTYAYIGNDEFNFATWARAVRKGNTFATTGPLLFLQADGHTPGEEIALGAGGGTIEIHAEAKCFVPIHRLEVVLNGEVVASRDEEAGAREISFHEKVQAHGSGWLAARCVSKLGPTTNWRFRLTAHTSPIYVRVPGQELLSESAAAYMLTLIEGCQTWVENLAIRPDPERFDRMRKVLREAHDRLHARLHHAGARH